MLFPVVDMISAIEFDKSGDFLAIGDRGGRCIIFERKDGKHVRIACTLSNQSINFKWILFKYARIF